MLQLLDLPVDTEEVIKFLRRGVALKGIIKKLIFQKVIEETAREHGISVSDEEIQTEAEEFRRSNRLESAASTLAWLDDELITPDEWEQGIYHRLLARKLAEHLFQKEADKHFSQNKIDFDLVSLYKITLPSESIAYEVFYQLEEREVSFFEAAYLYDISEENRLNCGFQGKVSRWNLLPELAPHILGASPGDIIHPLEIGGSYSIFMVERFIPASYSPDVRKEIINKLFNEWLEREFSYQFQDTRIKN